MKRPAIMMMFLIALPTLVQAQGEPSVEPDPEALFLEGATHLSAGDYEAAERATRQSLELRANPAAAFNLASALQGLARSLEAHQLLEGTTRGDYGQLSPGYEPLVVQLSQVVGASLANLQISVTGADLIEVKVAGEVVGIVSDGSTLQRVLNPGTYEVSATAAATSPSTETVRLLAGEHRRLRLTLQPLSAAGLSEPTAPGVTGPQVVPILTESDEGGVSPWVWVGIGAAIVVGASIALGFALSSSEPSTGRPFDCDPVFGCTDV